MPTETKIISREEAARRIGLSMKTLDRLCVTRALTKIRISERRVGFLESEIDRFLAERPSAVAA